MCCWWCCSLNDDWCSRRKGWSLESLEVLFVCKERWWKVCSSLACSGPRWMLMRRGVFEWEKFDVVTRGEKLACWEKACSTCADVFVHVDQVALDPVCKLSELLWNELSGHSGWCDRRCPRWRAGDVVPAVSLQWTLLVRQLQLVLSVGTVSSCSCEVETTYHWLCWCLLRRASSRCDARCCDSSMIWVQMLLNVDCQIVVCRILSMLVLIDVPWLKAARDDKRTLSVKLLRWGDWNLSWGWGRSHVRFLVVAVPSQSLVVHLPIAERLHHLMTKPDCCLFCVGVALLQVLRLSCTWKLMMRVLLDYRFADETWLLLRVLRSYQFAATANIEEHLVDEVHREIYGFPSGLPICCDSGIDDEDATKFIYNNGNNSSTDNITVGVAA